MRRHFVSRLVCKEENLADEYSWAEEYEPHTNGFWLYAKTKKEKTEGKGARGGDTRAGVRNGNDSVVPPVVGVRKIYLGID